MSGNFGRLSQGILLAVIILVMAGWVCSLPASAKNNQKESSRPKAVISPQTETSGITAQGIPLYGAKRVAVRLTVEAENGLKKIEWHVKAGKDKRYSVTLPEYYDPKYVPEPTETPTPKPTETPTPEPTETPTPEPTETPAPEPTETPTPEATEPPTPEPEATEPPTPEATEPPTPEPEPTETPTPEATEPTETPAPEPTETPTPEPTETPTPTPTKSPVPKGDPIPEKGAVIHGWTVEKTDADGQEAFVVRMSRVIYVTGERNDFKIDLSAADLDGNKSDPSSYEFGIDRTKPVIEISYDQNMPRNELYFANTRTARVQITDRNFDPDRTEVRIGTADGQLPLQGTWSRSENSDCFEKTIQFDQDGTYTLDVQAEDRGGNIAAPPRYAAGTAAAGTFVIDRQRPEIKISYDQNEAQNGFYFNKPRTAFITVTEQHFDPALADVRISRTMPGAGTPSSGTNALPAGMDASPPTSLSWEHSGDRHTAAIRFLEDGTYDLSISVSDPAGNQSASPQAEGTAPFHFVLDTGFDAAEVTGVKDGMVVRKTVSPDVVLSDVNFASCSIKVLKAGLDKREDITDQVFQNAGSTRKINAPQHGGRLLPAGTKTAGTKTAGTGTSGIEENGIIPYSTEANGTELRGEIKAGSREQDGLYEMRVSAWDLAGNRVDQTLEFTINCRGSVYIYDPYLISLRETCIRRALQPLIITEYNPSPLQGEGKIEVTRDGMPVHTLQSGFTKARVSGKKKAGKSWYQYQYTMQPDQFEEEGIYRIAVSGTDAAGNFLESSQTEAGEIRFSVDRTPPSLNSFISEEQPDQSCRIKLEAFDAMGLSMVQVTHEGKTLLYRTQFQDPHHFSGEFAAEQSAAEQSAAEQSAARRDEADPKAKETYRIVMRDLAGNLAVETRAADVRLSDTAGQDLDHAEENAGKSLHIADGAGGRTHDKGLSGSDSLARDGGASEIDQTALHAHKRIPFLILILAAAAGCAAVWAFLRKKKKNNGVLHYTKCMMENKSESNRNLDK